MTSCRQILSVIATAVACGVGACTAVAPTSPEAVYMAQVAPGVTLQYKQIESFKERKFRELVRQSTDFSCGAAAVATVFNYAYGRHTSEQQVLVNMLKVSDARVVRTKGFSLLDMKRYVEALGMRGDGYQVPFESLYELKVPAIVLLDIRGYKHFVVLRKARDGYVQIGDPALGNRMMWRKEFETAWNGIVFAILGDNYDQNNILARPAEPLSARKLYAQRSPVYNAELYDFGLGPSYQFQF
jgi:predicted double-glycine peptidase